MEMTFEVAFASFCGVCLSSCAMRSVLVPNTVQSFRFPWGKVAGIHEVFPTCVNPQYLRTPLPLLC